MVKSQQTNVYKKWKKERKRLDENLKLRKESKHIKSN